MGMSSSTTNKGLFSRIRASFKYLITGSGASSPWYWGSDYRYGTSIDYRERAGELSDNAIVMACVGWVMKNFAQPVRVMTKTPGPAKDTEKDNHPLSKLIQRPNVNYSGTLLMRATAFSLCMNNNAYWLVWPNRFGTPVEITYEPHNTIRVVYPSQLNNAGEWDPNTPLISHYEVYREGKWFRVERENVIHFRDSIDPNNPRMGFYMLGAALREVFTDNEAAAYTATILQNRGVPGMIISPSGDARIEDPKKLKAHLMANTQGDNRGEPVVMSDPVNVDIPAFSPTDMDVQNVRRTPETRIAALLGSGLAIAAGLEAGLAHSIYHNVSEAKASAFRETLIPMMDIVAEQINTQLLAAMGNADTEYIEFDLTEVSELQEDLVQRSQRLTQAVVAGMAIYQNEMREANGLPPIDELDGVYVGKDPLASPEPVPVPLQLQPGQQQAPLPPQLPPGQELVPSAAMNGSNGNGNGRSRNGNS